VPVAAVEDVVVVKDREQPALAETVVSVMAMVRTVVIHQHQVEWPAAVLEPLDQPLEPKVSVVQALAVWMVQPELHQVLAEPAVTDKPAAASASEVFLAVAAVAVDSQAAAVPAADQQVLPVVQVMIKEQVAVAPVVHLTPVA
jgi:hypothetical protein